MVEDLDLDELDQAVNNIMTKPRGKRAAKRPAEGQSEPAVKPESIAVNASRPAPQADEPASRPLEAEKSSDESPAPPPARAPEAMRVTVNRPMPRVPERRRMHPGAMDIIQPNSAAKAKAPSSRPGRMAADLQPAHDVAPEPVRPATPEFRPEPVAAPEPQPERRLDTPQDVSDEVLASLSLLDEKKPSTDFLAPDKKLDTPMLDEPEPKPVATSAERVSKSSDGWPDPLDFHDFGDKPAATTPVSTPTPGPMIAEPPVAPPKEAPPSLGTEPVSVTDSHDDAATVSSSPFVTTKVEKRPLGAFADAAHEPMKAPLPEPEEAHVPHESTSKGELAEASLESKQHLDTPQNKDGFDPTDLRSMTIPPQYHTAEQKPKEDVRHVFDTKEYHAAPPHMYAPRKGGPGLVIGVVVLIVLIIAAVLVGYFMMTGTFDVTQLW